MLKRDLTDVVLDYATVPLIMQYNKRDLANVIPADLLTEKLNERGVRSFGAVARDGVGVFETLSAIADLVTGRN